jgi:hypothetical protein
MLDGVLFFPVTPFGADGTLDGEAPAEHAAAAWHPAGATCLWPAERGSSMPWRTVPGYAVSQPRTVG